MNTNIYIEKKNEDRVYTILQYNVDQAMREEKHEETKWNNRSSRVKELINNTIKEHNVDIICLQELRKLPDQKETTEQFLASLGLGEDFTFVVDYRNSQPVSFGQAILINRKSLYVVRHVKYWLSDISDVPSDINGSGNGFILNGIFVFPVQGSKIVTPTEPFWIFNTHLPVSTEEDKTKCCEILKKLIPQHQSFVLAGDFNFFPDKDGNKQRASLGFKDLGKGAITSKGGVPCEGTFIGYQHDEFKADLKNMISRLDHVFGSQNIETVDKPLLINKTMTEFDVESKDEFDEERRYPSDHLPLCVKFKF